LAALISDRVSVNHATTRYELVVGRGVRRSVHITQVVNGRDPRAAVAEPKVAAPEPPSAGGGASGRAEHRVVQPHAAVHRARTELDDVLVTVVFESGVDGRIAYVVRRLGV